MNQISKNNMLEKSVLKKVGTSMTSEGLMNVLKTVFGSRSDSNTSHFRLCGKYRGSTFSSSLADGEDTISRLGSEFALSLEFDVDVNFTKILYFINHF